MPGSQFKDTSAKLGFADPGTLRALIREKTRQTMRSVQQLAPEEVVRLLVASLLRERGENHLHLEPLGAAAE